MVEKANQWERNQGYHVKEHKKRDEKQVSKVTLVFCSGPLMEKTNSGVCFISRTCKKKSVLRISRMYLQPRVQLSMDEYFGIGRL